MAIYLTGDIHGDVSRFYALKDYCINNNLDIDDWIVCLGDVGLNYWGDCREDAVKKIVSYVPVNLFCIHGNHERRPSKEAGYIKYKLNGNIIGEVWWNPNYPNQYFAIDGNLYEFLIDREFLTVLVCGGAYSVDKDYRLARGYHWWADEQPCARTKTKTINKAKENEIDIVLTHTCPLRFEPTELFLQGIEQNTVDKTTEKFLDDLYEILCKKKKPAWYFGHFHANKFTDDYTMLYDDIVELK